MDMLSPPASSPFDFQQQIIESAWSPPSLGEFATHYLARVMCPRVGGLRRSGRHDVSNRVLLFGRPCFEIRTPLATPLRDESGRWLMCGPR
jgi:hypothetical protein